MFFPLQRVSLLAFAFSVVGCFTVPASADDRSADRRRGLELFEKKIRPALVEHCYECHSEQTGGSSGGLQLDTRAGLLAGGDMGAAVRPGDVEASRLIDALEYAGPEMPPEGKLPSEVIAHFKMWISLGAPDPRAASGQPAGDTAAGSDEAQPEKLWSLRPVTRPEPPDVGGSSWPLSDVDRFVYDRLRVSGLQPNRDADPETLLRRVHFDLIGLPPSPEKLASFRADPSDEHLARIVDELLASPEFGRRWARHWLDVARYGESAGSSRDVLTMYAWRYRDYVIDALNRNLPYDRFVVEQVAGDLLAADGAQQRRRQQIATGLLAIGSKSLNGGNLTFDVIDDQIDVVSKAVIGMTVSCARCHDHKFDPIPTADYYALAGIFLSTDTRFGGGVRRPKTRRDRGDVYLSLGAPLSRQEKERRGKIQQRVDELQKQADQAEKNVGKLRKKVPAKFRKRPDQEIPEGLAEKKASAIRDYRQARRELAQIRRELKDARAEFGPEPDYAVGVKDAGNIRDARVLAGGEKNQPRDRVERGFLSAVGPLQPPSDSPAGDVGPIDDSESGRRQLAAWLVHPNNPLTPRVAVNRVWQHLMGSGLVETVDNFGASGSEPSHPKLLDYLAHRFVHRHDWSIKSVIRELVLSRTYRLSSTRRPEAFAADPENRLRWRMPRRRLSAEALRDAMLAVSGTLRSDPLAGSLVMEIGEGEVGRNIDTSVLEKPFLHRSVYLPIIRGIVPEELKLFDFPEPSNVQGRRDRNNTAKQALFLMNSDFAVRSAQRFAEDLLEQPSLASDAQRVRQARLRCFSREPTSDQLTRDLRFIRQMQRRAGKAERPRQRAWTAYCQTLLASAPFRFID